MILDVIQSLVPEQRKVLLLRYVDEYSYREIEQITGYDSGQVRSHLQNARRNFQLRWQRKFSREGT
jgi:RNA polymerase sigma-70 factor (ECF subfamily)